jgi:hypothetical protein
MRLSLSTLVVTIIGVGFYFGPFDHVVRSADEAKTKAAKPESKIFDLPLRVPGFLFLELRVCDVGVYKDFFRDVAGYEIARDDGNFMILNTGHGEILLSGEKKKDAPQEIKVTRRYGGGVEIGIVVGDIEAAFAAAEKHTQYWPIASKIEKQPWGVRDFRVHAPDGFYVRVTE